MLHFFSMRKKVFANCQLSRPLFIGSPLLQRSKNSRWICVLIEFEWLGRVENKTGKEKAWCRWNREGVARRRRH